MRGLFSPLDLLSPLCSVCDALMAGYNNVSYQLIQTLLVIGADTRGLKTCLL